VTSSPRPGVLRARLVACVLALGCGGPAEPPAPSEAAAAARAAKPEVEAAAAGPAGLSVAALRAPAERVSGLAKPLSAEEAALAGRLEAHVTKWAFTQASPWAWLHGIEAVGLEAAEAARPGLAAQLAAAASPAEAGDARGLDVPSKLGELPAEPHEALTLKVLVDAGVDPAGDGALSELARGLAARAAWIAWADEGARLGAGSVSGAPWLLAGLAAWVPPGTRWRAQGGRQITLDALADAVAQGLAVDNAPIEAMRAAGGPLDKRKQGLFGHACGGAHLLQGAALAVAFGHGSPAAAADVRAAARTHPWRVEAELALVDDLVAAHPEHALLLGVQRLKVVGHALETVALLSAWDLWPAEVDAGAHAATLRGELLATVTQLDGVGAFERMEAVRAERAQTFLDLIGDSAHALHGLRLVSGGATVPMPPQAGAEAGR
jgi:hypothetical protein